MNKYSVGLLLISIACGAYAQDTASSGQNEFERMFAQGRQESRDRLVQNFTKAQKENEAALSQGAGSSSQLGQNGPMPPGGPGQAGPIVPPQPSSAAHVPVPSANPTNTPGSTPNIYVPTPSNTAPPQPQVPPPQMIQPPTSAGQSSQLPPANTNIYR